MFIIGYFVIVIKKILKLWLIKKFLFFSKVKMNIYINVNIYLLGFYFICDVFIYFFFEV